MSKKEWEYIEFIKKELKEILKRKQKDVFFYKERKKKEKIGIK